MATKNSVEGAARSEKDCRTCNRRRIKCDRSLPTCVKCTKKGLTCPGYGLRLQWNQGVASRGKLAGKSLPVIQSSDSVLKRPTKRSNILASAEAAPCGSLVLHSSSSSTKQRRSQDGLSAQIQTPSLHYTRSFDSQFAIDLDLSLSPLPRCLQDESARRLIHYFDNVVAAAMPWVDGPENSWRTRMLPLSMHSPSLLLAILALAAEHSSVRMGSSWYNENSIISRNYRDKSIELVARDLRLEAEQDGSVLQQDLANSTLATILVLCNLEMVQSDSALWRVHWRAARTIIGMWTSSNMPLAATNLTSRFLIDEAFVIDVFASSTTFNDDGEMPGSIPAEADSNVFTEFLQLIQEITRAERRRHSTSNDSDKTGRPLSTLATFQKRFEYTRERSIFFAAAINFGSAKQRAVFANIIDIYHHAGLIYCYQALGNETETFVTRKFSMERLIGKLDEIQDCQIFQQNIVWPLFIAGTESRQDHDNQKKVEIRILEAMRSTGFSNCVEALNFLRRFWQSEISTASNWMSFARQETERGISFLVF